jgi:hypothetical protein
MPSPGGEHGRREAGRRQHADESLPQAGVEGDRRGERLAAAAELAGSGASPIRAGYREVQPTAHHVEHGYSLPVVPFPVHGPAVPSRRYFRT